METQKITMNLEDCVAEVEGVLKLLGEAYQKIVEEDHCQGTAACGMQIMRLGAVNRLRAAADEIHTAYHLARRDLDDARAQLIKPRRAA